MRKIINKHLLVRGNLTIQLTRSYSCMKFNKNTKKRTSYIKNLHAFKRKNKAIYDIQNLAAVSLKIL